MSGSDIQPHPPYLVIHLHCPSISRLYSWKDEILDGLSQDTISTQITNSNGVIKACNFPVSMSMKEHSYHINALKCEREKASKFINDLILLHENTITLPHEVLNGDGRAILDSFTPPNQHYVNSIFDQIETRHGNSVETLADAVISARHAQELMGSLANNKLGVELNLLNDDAIIRRLLYQTQLSFYQKLANVPINHDDEAYDRTPI